MGYFVMPTEKEFRENPAFAGMDYNKVYGPEFTCDVCKARLVGGDRYIVVRNDEQVKKDGKPGFRHILCDPDYFR